MREAYPNKYKIRSICVALSRLVSVEALAAKGNQFVIVLGKKKSNKRKRGQVSSDRAHKKLRGDTVDSVPQVFDWHLEQKDEKEEKKKRSLPELGKLQGSSKSLSPENNVKKSNSSGSNENEYYDIHGRPKSNAKIYDENAKEIPVKPRQHSVHSVA